MLIFSKPNAFITAIATIVGRVDPVRYLAALIGGICLLVLVLTGLVYWSTGDAIVWRGFVHSGELFGGAMSVLIIIGAVPMFVRT